MKWRLLFLGMGLLLRFVLGWVDVSKYQPNRLLLLTGNIDNIYQNNSKCIIQIGRFWIDYRTGCTFSRNAKVKVAGRVRKGLIDNILGRLWLDSAEITYFEDGGQYRPSRGENPGWLGSIREKIVGKYTASLNEPEAGLVAGIVLGYKKDIGQTMYDLMIKSGTVHIAVASGYNIMLVGGTVLAICFWVMKRKWAVVVAVTAMVLYAIEAGGEAPVIRAVIMGTVVFAATIAGRRAITWWILLVTAWVMILIEPLMIVNVSFWLSMSASVGLMVIEPKLSGFISSREERLAGILSGSGLTTSVSTMMMTLPIIWVNFGRMSLIGILSNTLILPLVPILMIFGAGMQILPGVFSWPTYVIAHWMVGVIRFFGS
jgi:ComEC/Rec2-related protein